MLVAAYYNVLFKKHAAIFTKTVESSDSQIYNKSRLAASTMHSLVQYVCASYNYRY